MFQLLQSELFRMRKRPQSWILYILTLALTALVYGGFVIAARVASGSDAEQMRQDATFSNFESLGLSMSVGFFASVMLIIIGAGMMGNEYSWNTLRPLVARSRSRVSMLTAKIVALGLYSVAFVVATVLAVTAFFFIGSWVVGESSGFTTSLFWDGVVYAFKLLYTNVPYLALAFMLATVFRSNAAGIAGALGLTFIEQPIWVLLGLASDFFDKLQKWGISYNVSQLAGDDGDVARSATILAAYSAIFLAITYLVFTRRDVTSG